VWAEAFVDGLVAELAPLRNGERAAAMRAYMRDRFEFLGVHTPERRAATERVLAVVGAPDADGLEALGPLGWTHDEREVQYAAVDVLGQFVRTAQPELLDVVAGLVTTKSWWDTVDALAASVVGPLVRRFPELVAALDDWIDGDQLWLARTAILHQLRFKRDTDTDRLFAYSLAWAGHPDFFARKAVGWALRQYARTDPDAVRSFLAANAGVLSPLTVREASKHL
jgi:3-methyladenine DNA glycosylase AlkD